MIDRTYEIVDKVRQKIIDVLKSDCIMWYVINGRYIIMVRMTGKLKNTMKKINFAKKYNPVQNHKRKSPVLCFYHFW